MSFGATLSPLWALACRDARLVYRSGAEIWIAVAFTALAGGVFPLGIGPEPNLLVRIAPGVVTVVALLAVLLTLDRVFQADFDDGSLDQLAIGGPPLDVVCAVKMLTHWVIGGVPVALAGPVLALAFGLPPSALAVLAVALLLVTLALSLIGGIGAALTLGARRGGVLLVVLVLPLMVPCLVFAAGAADAAAQGLPVASHLLILAGIVVAALPIAPIVAAAAARQAIGA